MNNSRFKFRIWCQNSANPKYYYDSYKGFVITLDGGILHLATEDFWVGPRENQSDYIIQQFTGLKDKNDKDIYEGDIVKFTTKVEHGDAEDNIGEIWYDDSVGIWLFGKWWMDTTPTKYINGKWEKIGAKSGLWVGSNLLDGTFLKQTLEVIGNVFENPELLKS